MPTPPSTTPRGDADTVVRILDGAMRVAARKGIRKMSMSDISESAGVSRGTVYRYFPSKDHVLGSLTNHALHRWEQHMRAAVAARPRAADRLRVVMDSIVGYGEACPEALEIIRLDQDLGLTFLHSCLPDTVRIMADLLEPVIDEAAVVRARVITGPELAELVYRIGLAAFLVPATRTKQLPRRVAAVWDFLNGAALSVHGADEETGESQAEITQFTGGSRRLA
ncbi:TetR family transcriptional regulator [Actinocorallia herbida]|uniref:TetR family transcriptional regulator n=1 Tax=Actinocorallia herbida TaxID=58109 RepID=A0A3N1D3F1_9ACTN|nr:TetR/AcrR family transcriptional regulator [Actinocorallia herbida]ROO88026.1 TetR family transcriptional regulator [Actinocorallia herbida]